MVSLSISARLFRPLSSKGQRLHTSTASEALAASGRHGRRNHGGHNAALLGLSAVVFATAATTAAGAFEVSTCGERRHGVARWEPGRSAPSVHPGGWISPPLLRPRTALCSSAVAESEVRDEILVRDGDKLTIAVDASFYYERIHPPHRSLTENHAIFGPLLGKGLIERFNMYRRVNLRPPDQQLVGASSLSSSSSGEPMEVAVGDVQVGDSLNGHDGIVHGGIISLLFDDAMGWGYEALVMSDETRDKDATIVTANLNINFRNPLPEKTKAIIRVFHERSEGRKVYFRARMESQDGSIVYSEATSLFVVLKKKPLKERVTPGQ